MIAAIIAATAVWFKIMPPSGEYLENRLIRVNGHMMREVVVVTTNDSARVAQNLNDRVEQGERIILDIEHESNGKEFDESRMCGEMVRFRSNADGSIDSLIALTDFGRAAIASGVFTHISPALITLRPIGNNISRVYKVRSAALTLRPHTQKCPLVPLGERDVNKNEYGYWEIGE